METYWAAKPTDECAQELSKRIDAWYEWCRATGTYDFWLRSLREFYSGAVTQGTLGTSGESEEWVTSKENHLHNIGMNVVTMVTGSRPAFEPKAKNSDHASASQVIIATGLLDNAMREKDLEGIGITVVTDAGCLFGEAYSTATWDVNAGQPYTMNPETNQRVTTGDVAYKSYVPLDVARDHTKSDPEGHQWYALRDWENKHDLAAKHADKVDKIASLPNRLEEARARYSFSRDWKGIAADYSDDVAVWTMYHARSPAVPDGRMVRMAGADLVLFDGPLPYDDMPVIRMAPEEMRGTQLGYSTLFDCLAPQHEVNAADTTITTSISNVGTGIIWAPPGGDVSVEDIQGGPKVIRSTAKPEPVTLIDTASLTAMDNYKRGKITAMEAISGVNSARRGTLVNDKAMSGAALALLDAKTLEYSKGLERGYIRWLERMATATVRLYKRYATVPMVAMVAGKANRSYMKEFTGASLDRIERVTVDLGNPLARTTSGRLSLAEMLLDRQLIRTPEQVIQVLTTGRLDPIIEGTNAELMNIRAENERMQEGKQVSVVVTDNHILHLKEHASVMASPEAREDEGLVTAVTTHLQEHINVWTTTDPALLAALGIPPPPMAAPVTPPGETAPGGGGVPPGPESPAVPAPEGMNPQEAGSMPRMPINPANGERAPMPQ